MSSLKLSLQILVDLEGIAHFIINEELIWDGQRNQELSSIGFALELLESSDDPIQNVLDCAFVSMDHISLEVRIKVRWISEDLQESTYSLLGLILSFLLDINTLMLIIQVTKKFVQ